MKDIKSSLKYKCLVLDHDDTVVDSTFSIHYPQFVTTLSKLRPQITMSVDQFTQYCYEPGFHALCMDILNFSEEEMAYQLREWKAYVRNHSPSFFPGMQQIIQEYKAAGGIICVVSHSCDENIIRDYLRFCNFQPDMIFGWELGETMRKPNPYPLNKIMETYHLLPSDLIMVDDLKPGYDMAKACDVDFACAGWSHRNETIKALMKEHCKVYLDKVEELTSLLYK